MPGIAVNIKLDDRDAREAIRRLIHKADFLRPAFVETGEYLMTTTHHRFDTESDPRGRPWSPLAASTIKEKERRGWSRNILIRSGRFRASIHPVATNKSVAKGPTFSQKISFSTRPRTNLEPSVCRSGNGSASIKTTKRPFKISSLTTCGVREPNFNLSVVRRPGRGAVFRPLRI